MNSSKKIPVNIITGFLGAGKTTALIHLLTHKKGDEKWAVVINEFGKVSIDYEALKTKTSSQEKFFEISGGCICCSAQDNFQQNLEQIIYQNKFSRIIIEPSGLGGTDMITEIVNKNHTLTLHPIIVLVPIDYLKLDRLTINPIFKRQLVSAQILVLSKCDLEPDLQKLEDAFNKLKLDYPGKLLYTKAENGTINEELLTPAKHNLTKNNKFDNLFFTGTELNDSKHSSLCFTCDANKSVKAERLANLLIGEKHVVRAKGFINNGKCWCLFNYTLGCSETEPWSTQHQNKLVVIAETKNKQQLIALAQKLNKLLCEA